MLNEKQLIISILKLNEGHGVNLFGGSIEIFQLEDLATFAVTTDKFDKERRAFVADTHEEFDDIEKAVDYFISERKRRHLGFSFEKA